MMLLLLFSDVCVYFCDQQIMDEKKMPHLCVFALTKINAGEEIVYDFGDPNCPWRRVFQLLFLYLILSIFVANFVNLQCI